MKITFKQEGCNNVDITLNLEELDTFLDYIGEDQIENVSITIKKPEVADNGEEN